MLEPLHPLASSVEAVPFFLERRLDAFASCQSDLGRLVFARPFLASGVLYF